MKLYNTLTRTKEEIKEEEVGIYSCGPTVYDSVHIGNLYAFIMADTLRRALVSSNKSVKHVMNITDVDDKTIKRCRIDYADLNSKDALKKTTQKFTEIFLNDSAAIGIDTKQIDFIKATDSIDEMIALVKELLDGGFAYVAEDGIYFSIEKYKQSGKKYGQLVDITAESTGAARVANDEYDKDNIHDFALWKKAKDGEPEWKLEVEGKDMSGRPGWHIECSAMSKLKLGQPFDIHTGGVDLKFPHHENEIAQSTATGNEVYAKIFMHNEHVMVDGKKMSKSLNNFYTLSSLKDKGYSPLAFRMLAIQAHYRSRANFSWDNLEAASNRLDNIRSVAELRWQTQPEHLEGQAELINKAIVNMHAAIEDDLNTPKVLEAISVVTAHLGESHLAQTSSEVFDRFLNLTDNLLGLDILGSTPDISAQQKELLAKRQAARDESNYEASDQLRDQLAKSGVEVSDSPTGQIWHKK